MNTVKQIGIGSGEPVFTAKTTTGKEFKVVVSHLKNRTLYGKIGEEVVEFSAAQRGRTTVATIYLDKNQVESLLGIKGGKGGHVELDCSIEEIRTLRRKMIEGEEQKKKEVLAPLVEKANNARLVSFTFIMGCDCADEYSFDYDDDENLPWEAKCERTDRDERLIRILKKEKLNNLAKKLNAEEIPETFYSYGGWKFTGEGLSELVAIANEKADKRDADKREKSEAEKKRQADIFAKAKETGVKQQLGSWMDECNDPHEDCSFDSIILYAMPDGTTTEQRHHCH